MTTRTDLARAVYDSAHLTGEFLLRSGATSTEYFDKYQFESDPRLLRRIAEALAELVPDGVDALAGLELGGVPLATALSQVTGLPTLFVRKAAKPYGTALGAEIAGVVCVIDREAGGVEKLAAEGLELRALFTMSELKAAAGSR
jgi:orotate phosphoribosyltransferase